MLIESFKYNNFKSIKKCDTNRLVGYSEFKSVIFTGRNLFFPNVLLYTEEKLINPYDEKVMSLNKDCFYDNNEYDYDNKLISNFKKGKYYFFIYNFENYYHFIYDTIPYLYLLKKLNLADTVLVNYPNKNMERFFEFNMDLIRKLNIKTEIVDRDNIYETVNISSSLTHGGFPNNPPCIEFNEFYDNFLRLKINSVDYRPRVYISRRTWINNDTKNIGTNYTTRRKMINEDELVSELNKLNIIEVFAENLSMEDKIKMFSSAELVIGSIGGGMANLLFSPKDTKSVVIVTPYFMDINYRFKYSMENTNITYFDDVSTYKEDNNIPLYCRVKYNNIIGEIGDYKDGKYLINLSNNDIVGFSQNNSYQQIWANDNEFELLDKGLNSPYVVDINKLTSLIKKIL